jgi:hypothetical protein
MIKYQLLPCNESSNPHALKTYLWRIFVILTIGAFTTDNVLAGITQENTAIKISLDRLEKQSEASSDSTVIRIKGITKTREQTTYWSAILAALGGLASFALCPANTVGNCLGGTFLGTVPACIYAHKSTRRAFQNTDAHVISYVAPGCMAACLCSGCASTMSFADPCTVGTAGIVAGAVTPVFCEEICLGITKEVLDYLDIEF